RRHAELDVLRPGVLARLLQRHLAVLQRYRRGGAHVQHRPDPRVAVGVDPLAHPGNVTDDVRRTARAVEPRHAVMLAFAAERVDVDEAVAAQRYAGQQAVVDLALQDVGVLAVAGHEEQAVVPQGHADGGARLRVGRVVGQVVGDRETLVVGRRADAAGDIHL